MKCRGVYLAKQNSKYIELGERYLKELKLNSRLEGHVIAAHARTCVCPEFGSSSMQHVY
jgi:hypothetical protein